MVKDRIESLIQEIETTVEEKGYNLPRRVWMAIEDIRVGDVRGEDSVALQILGNYEPSDLRLQELFEELYETVKESIEGG